MPHAEYDQLVNGEAFIHENGTYFTHACCDCGSAHSINLTVLNAEEIEVRYTKNQKASADFRSMHTNGVLISERLSRSLPHLLDLMRRKKNKEARRLLKSILKDEKDFQHLYASGDYLS